VGADVDLLPLERACLAYGLFDPAGIEERGDVPAVVHDFKLPVTYWIPRLPLPFGRFLSRKTRFFPEIRSERCTRCGLCARTCPNGAIHRGQGDYSIDYSRCIACMCCQEICPSHAVRLGGTGAARAFRVFRGLSRRLSRGGRKPTPAA
jgi:ferredoxin